MASVAVRPAPTDPWHFARAIASAAVLGSGGEVGDGSIVRHHKKPAQCWKKLG
jgi:hypothetical protein